MYLFQGVDCYVTYSTVNRWHGRSNLMPRRSSCACFSGHQARKARRVSAGHIVEERHLDLPRFRKRKERRRALFHVSSSHLLVVRLPCAVLFTNTHEAVWEATQRDERRRNLRAILPSWCSSCTLSAVKGGLQITLFSLHPSICLKNS